MFFFSIKLKWLNNWKLERTQKPIARQRKKALDFFNENNETADDSYNLNEKYCFLLLRINDEVISTEDRFSRGFKTFSDFTVRVVNLMENLPKLLVKSNLYFR